jgi:hypothetical protein
LGDPRMDARPDQLARRAMPQVMEAHPLESGAGQERLEVHWECSNGSSTPSSEERRPGARGRTAKTGRDEATGPHLRRPVIG